MKHLASSSGFSLVELMVTVALVIMILGFFAAYTTSATFKLEGEANRVCAALQKTRMESIMRNKNTLLSFDIDNDGVIDNRLTLWVDENGNNTYDGGAELIESIAEGSNTAFGSVSSAQGGPSQPPPTCSNIPADGVDFNTTGNSNCARFSPNGTSTSGVVLVRSSNDSAAGTYAIVLSSVGLPRLWYFQPGTAGWKDR